METNFALFPGEDKRLELAADQVVNVRSYTENMSHLFANYCSLSVWCSCLFEARQCLSVEQKKGSWKLTPKVKTASLFCTAQKKTQSSFGPVERCLSTLVAMVPQCKGCTKHFI